MRLLDADIDGFGRLHQQHLSLDADLVVVYGPNEAGKSTLFQYICTMLYGFSRKNNKNRRQEPVFGGRHGGRIRLADSAGNRYEIERYADLGLDKLELRLLSQAGAVVDHKLQKQLLTQAEWEQQHLQYLHEKAFRDVMAITTEELQQLGLIHADELGAHLAQAAHQHGKLVDSMKRSLRQEMDQLYKPRGTTQTMYQTLQQIAAVDQQMRQRTDEVELFNEKRKEATNLQVKLDQLDQECRQTERDCTTLEQVQHYYLLWQKEQREALERQLVAITKKEQDDSEYEQESKEQKPVTSFGAKKSWYGVGVLLLLSLILYLIGLEQHLMIGAAFLLTSLGAVSLAVYAWMCSKDNTNDAVEVDEELERGDSEEWGKSGFGKISEQLLDASRLFGVGMTGAEPEDNEGERELFEQYLTKHMPAGSDSLILDKLLEDEQDLSMLEQRVSEAYVSKTRRLTLQKQQLTQLIERRGRLQEQVDQAKALSDAQQELPGKREQARAQLEDEARRYAVLAIAERLLQQAEQQHERQRKPAMLERASQFLQTLTTGRYVRILLEEDKQNVWLEDQAGRTLPVSALSKGASEQVFLALRLATSLELAPEAELPLLLDDVLVNADMERVRGASKVLSQISKQRQIIYLTCHPHIRDELLAACSGAQVVELSANLRSASV